MSSENERKRALARAYRLLSLRSRSEEEMRRGLQRAGVSDFIADETVSYLRQQGYLNDREFAVDWTRCRMQSRPRGRKLIEHELRARGVSGEDASAAAAEVDDDATALALARRRARLMQGLDRQTFTRRLANFLRARGFSGESVSKAIAAVLSGSDDS